METLNGLVVDAGLPRAGGVSECLPSVDLADAHVRPGAPLAGDKGVDAADPVADLGARRITRHVAPNQHDTGKARRRSNIDGRTTRHPGYAVRQRIRKRIEEIVGWLQSVTGRRKSRFRGPDRPEHGLHLALSADNLARMPKLLA